jgi:hypothetical protein
MDSATAQANPTLSPWVRVLSIIVLLFLINGSTLLLWPSFTVPRWPWTIPPFNARFLGAIYLAEAASVLVLVFCNRWSPGRVALLIALVFTTVVSITTLMHLDRFPVPRRALLWFVLYIGYVALPAIALWTYWDLPRVAPLPLTRGWRMLLIAAGTLMIAYGLAQFIAPAVANGFWPWPIDAMHGQIYSGVFLAGGVGLCVIARNGRREEFLALGLASLVLGLAAIVGLVLADLDTHRVDWSAPGTWAWIAMFAAFFALGLAILQQWRRPAAG